MAAVSLYEGVLILSLLIFADGQNVCQDGTSSIIGSDNQGKYEPEERERGRLYLNMDNPAPCSGFITQLEYCYYPPESASRLQTFNFYQTYFAIYRARERQNNGIGNVQSLYQRQSELVRLGGFSGGEFSCMTLNISKVSVQEGDIIGACLPEMNSLDVVSEISDEEHFNADLSYVESGCRSAVNEHNLGIQEGRILHLYARITTNTGGEIPITTSEPASSTASAVTDRPLTEPDSNNVSVAMLRPSESPSTFSLSGRQSSSIPTVTVIPIIATSAEIIPDIQSTTSISIEASVGDQTLIISPTSTEALMTFTNTRILISTLEAYLMTSFITQSHSIEGHPPVSTTRILTTVSTSSEQASPDQPVTVSSRSESTLPAMTTVTIGPQNLEQRSLSTATTVIIVIVVIVFVVLAAALVGIFARKYRKRRYRYYPAFKHTILEEDESTYSQISTIAQFDNVLYSNYSETVQIQDARNLDHVYDNNDSSATQPEPQSLENTYSEVQEKVDSDSYSYAVISGKVDPRLPEQRPYDPNREKILSVFCAPASKESDLYAQLKLCGVKNIRRDTIEVTGNLGSGQFGDVKKGVWRNEKLKVPVALKTLKEGSQQVDKVKFLQEAAIMAQFSHPNVAVLYGVVSKGEPIMLVVELVEKGNLLDYLAFLKENNDSVHLTNLPNVLLNFSRKVALGMCYLSERGFVHRDLAARNILVSNDDICKIADFGMSRDLADKNYYVSQGGKIPVKWTAPEAINYKKYSTASDVWSYGCLLYEIWSLGHKPYENLSNLQVVRHLELGQRLSPPPGCPRKIYELMILCWNPELAFRPKFSDLALMFVGDRKEVLGIPQEDLATHPLAGVLGAPLEAGEGMHLDLQNRYVFN